MRKTIYILLILLSYTAYSQSISVFNVDASNFPALKANFFILDENSNQITDLNSSDFRINENGVSRVITDISCPNPTPSEAISSVLVMDVSGSMYGSGLNIAKAAANAWIDMINLDISECAITSFSDDNFINQDFTSNKTKLASAINSLYCLGGTNFDEAMIGAMAGGVLIAKSGKSKRAVIFLTDGGMNFEPNTAEIIKAATADNIAIYCINIGYPAPQCMKDFSAQTGGLCFENILTQGEAEDCFRKILINSQDGSPCFIEWQSVLGCKVELIRVELEHKPYGITAYSRYQTPFSKLGKLEITPSSLKFNNAIPGIQKDTTITITARNADINVTNVSSSNPSYLVNPTSFFLGSGQSKDITVSYVSADSGYTCTKITFENDKCPAKYYASGGFSGKDAKIQTLRLIHPNGNEIFVVGMDTVITWEGVLPEDKVKIDYTTDKGLNWSLVTDSATGLSYNWTIPKTPSDQCLARITANLGYEAYRCTVGDVQICNQIWMGCNLDVTTYRDGTPIPEVRDTLEWNNLTTGAWCYYNNDPLMGAIYGKLYNRYAVNDKRGLAPDGWHIPTDAEWTELSDCLGGEKVAGDKLKSRGTIEDGDGLWYYHYVKATNESGFTALPGGERYDYGTFNGIGFFGYWWGTNSSGRYLSSSSSYIYNGGSNGSSVRCVKD